MSPTSDSLTQTPFPGAYIQPQTMNPAFLYRIVRPQCPKTYRAQFLELVETKWAEIRARHPDEGPVEWSLAAGALWSRIGQDHRARWLNRYIKQTMRYNEEREAYQRGRGLEGPNRASPVNFDQEIEKIKEMREVIDTILDKIFWYWKEKGFRRRGRAGADPVWRGSRSATAVDANDDGEYRGCGDCHQLGDRSYIYCDGCPRKFHGVCLQPQIDLISPPLSRWYCPRCVLRRGWKRTLESEKSGIMDSVMDRAERIDPEFFHACPFKAVLLPLFDKQMIEYMDYTDRLKKELTGWVEWDELETLRLRRFQRDRQATDTTAPANANPNGVHQSSADDPMPSIEDMDISDSEDHHSDTHQRRHQWTDQNPASSEGGSSSSGNDALGAPERRRVPPKQQRQFDFCWVQHGDREEEIPQGFTRDPRTWTTQGGTPDFDVGHQRQQLHALTGIWKD